MISSLWGVRPYTGGREWGIKIQGSRTTDLPEVVQDGLSIIKKSSSSLDSPRHSRYKL